MIKSINAFIIIAVILLTGLIFYTKFFRYTADLPAFTYINLQTNLSYSDNDIPKNKETVIAYVSVSCGTCERTIQAIIKNLDAHKNYLIIASEKNDRKAKKFFGKLIRDQRVVLLNDPNNSFPQDFKLGYSVVYPTVFIFDSENQRVSIFNNF